MQPSISWSSSVSVFVIEKTAIIHSLKCTVPFSLVVPLLSLAVSHCYLLSLVATHCITPCHSLSLVFIRCHWLSLDVPLTCLFINDRNKASEIKKKLFLYFFVEVMFAFLLHLLIENFKPEDCCFEIIWCLMFEWIGKDLIFEWLWFWVI